MAGRWRVWDSLYMEEEFLCISNIEASHSNETDILPVPGCRSIPSIDVFSFTLPKEALDLEHDSSSWRTRGRGKSLADRALRSRELCRRPGNEMKNTAASEKSQTSGKHFMNSELNYDELFPSLNASISKKTDRKPAVRKKTERCRGKKNSRTETSDDLKIGDAVDQPDILEKVNESENFIKTSNHYVKGLLKKHDGIMAGRVDEEEKINEEYLSEDVHNYGNTARKQFDDERKNFLPEQNDGLHAFQCKGLNNDAGSDDVEKEIQSKDLLQGGFFKKERDKDEAQTGSNYETEEEKEGKTANGFQECMSDNHCNDFLDSSKFSFERHWSRKNSISQERTLNVFMNEVENKTTDKGNCSNRLLDNLPENFHSFAKADIQNSFKNSISVAPMKTHMSLKETNVMSEEVHVTTQETLLTPQESSVTPQETLVTPQETLLTPQDTQVTNEEIQVTPQETQVTSEEIQVTPQETLVTPQETQVTTEKIQVTPQETQVTTEKILVTPQETQVTSEEIQVTPQETLVTPLETQLTTEEIQVIPLETEVTTEKIQVTPQETLVTSEEIQVTSQETLVTPLETQLTTEEIQVIPLETEVTTEKIQVTPQVTSEVIQVTPKETHVTTNETRVTPHEAQISPQEVQVTQNKTQMTKVKMIIDTDKSSTDDSAAVGTMVKDAESITCDNEDKYDGFKHVTEDALEVLSTSDEDTGPCDVLMENLPLTFTEEELREMVEPYGKMVSFHFTETDNSLSCTIRISNSSSGELLAVSLDGLEINGQRAKVTVDENDI
ncbi:uncharacterized protein LOC124449805 [Xenia sp. Carnegie-2017]|uniref:uncharacterized protein LOC124449805 n=1 Tax=Xenia sp. Carnegie-2017 TaxID=2897299 RepID=UPI001F03D290|nr:uncharacterized protein LOC124449805 [Xenia sp. Carnegie-2017]